MSTALCVALEGRANLLDAGLSSCAELPIATCALHFVSTDTDRTRFELCAPVAAGARCAPSSSQPLSCGVDAGLARVRTLRAALEHRLTVLRNASLGVILEQATVALASVFELAIGADARLSAESVEAMLRYQLETRRASPYGWVAPGAPFELRQVARQLVVDQISGTIALLQRDIINADARLVRAASRGIQPTHRPLRGDSWRPEAWRAKALDAPASGALTDLRGSVRVAGDGYLHCESLSEGIAAAGHSGRRPCFVAGFNSAANLMRQQRDGEWELDSNGARALRDLGVNTFVVIASPVALLRDDLTLNPSALEKLRWEVGSAVAAGFVLIIHVPSAMPRWALQRYSDLGVSEGQHSISYDIDHPMATELMRAYFRALLPALRPPPPPSPPPSSPSPLRGGDGSSRGGDGGGDGGGGGGGDGGGDGGRGEGGGCHPSILGIGPRFMGCARVHMRARGLPYHLVHM